MKSTVTLVLLLACLGGRQGFAQWTWENPLPQGNTLHAIHFIDAATGWAVGEAGTILHSADGGATWTMQPSSTARDLADVFFVDAQHGWATGADVFSSVILHTSDGGATWSTQYTLAADQLVAVFFVEALTGWAVGNRTILHTTDGGLTWAEQPTGLDPAPTSLNDVAFADAQQGWIVGGQGLILHTADGGANWNVQDSGGAPDLNAVAFVDAATGWAVGRNGAVRHTTNGGATWTPQDGGPPALFTDVHFVDARRGWIATNQRTAEGTAIRATTDGGATWAQVNTGALRDLMDVHFADALTGWIVGVAGEIHRTTDGGATWAKQSSGPHESFWDLFHSPDGFVAAIGPPQFFLYVNPDPARAGKSSGGEESDWIILNPDKDSDLLLRNNGNRGKGIVQLGSRNSYVDGGAQRRASLVNGNMAGQVEAAPGGGFETTLYEIDTQEEFGGLDTPMPLTWWITGSNGALLRSDDGGLTWAPQNSGVAVALDDAFFTTLDDGWVVGDQGTLLHTTDGGATWAPQPSSTTARLRKIHFADARAGWIVGDRGTLLHTSDGGATWTPQTSGTSFRLYDVEPLDAMNAWVVGDNGLILHTTDGGQTWTNEPSGTTNALLAVDFFDAVTGWISGEGGTILRFAGAPANAPPIITNALDDLELRVGAAPFTHDLTTVFSDPDGDALAFSAVSTDEAVAEAALTNAVLTVTARGAGTADITVAADDGRGGTAQTAFTVTVPTEVGVEPLGGEIPAEVALLPNYPNPFNPSTTIRFGVPRAGPVRLAVFDVLGRHVATLVAEALGAGHYAVLWEAAAAPGGVYFLRLQAAGRTVVRKMTLLR